jgi:hypothetical protein
VLLGRGTSYYLTAYEARERSGRKPSSDTYLPAFWLERFAPAILQQLLPQPDNLGIILVDQAPFHVADVDARGYPVPGGRMRFTVFGAAAQMRVGAPLTVLRLGASWRKDIPSWRAFLKAVPGEADLIVCDGEAAINQTARVRWPEAKLSISEWHLLHRAEEILVKADRHSRRDPLYRALRHALRTASEWRAFVKLARASKLSALESWINEVDAVVGGQLRRREHPRSTGALEAKLAEIKKMLTLQRGSYDSLERLNLLLGLMTLRANHLDGERNYAEIVRNLAE